LGLENFLIGFGISLVGPLIPVITTELNISYSKMGLILSMNSLGSLATVLITGSIIEIFPFILKKINQIYAILVITSFTGIYFAMNFYSFFIYYFIFGLAVGGLVVVTTIISNNLYDFKLSNVLLKINLFSIAGLIIGTIMVSIFLNFDLNWRYLFIFITFLQFALFIYFIFLKYEKKVNVINNNVRFLLKINKKIALNKRVFTCLIISLLHGGVIAVSYTWMTTFLMKTNIPIKNGSIFVVFFSISMIVSILLKIVLLRVIKETLIILINGILSIIFIALFFCSGYLLLKIIFLLLFGININGIFTLVASLSIKSIPEHSSSVTGIVNAISYTGSIIFQYIAGRLSDNYSNTSMTYLILISLALLVLASIFLQLFWKKEYNINTV